MRWQRLYIWERELTYTCVDIWEFVRNMWLAWICGSAQSPGLGCLGHPAAPAELSSLETAALGFLRASQRCLGEVSSQVVGKSFSKSRSSTNQESFANFAIWLGFAFPLNSVRRFGLWSMSSKQKWATMELRPPLKLRHSDIAMPSLDRLHKDLATPGYQVIESLLRVLWVLPTVIFHFRSVIAVTITWLSTSMDQWISRWVANGCYMLHHFIWTQSSATHPGCSLHLPPHVSLNCR